MKKSKAWFLIGFSLRRKIFRKSFFISNAVILLVVALLANLDQIVSFFSASEPLSFTVYYEDAFENRYQSIFQQSVSGQLPADQEIIVVAFANQTIQSDEELIVRLDEGFIASIESNTSIPSLTYNAIFQSLNQVKLIEISSQYDLTLEEVMRLSTPVSINRAILVEEVTSEEDVLMQQGVAYAITLPLFLALVFVIQMVGMEIFEEKSTKSTEIILSNVTPQDHLIAKIAATNLYSWLQFLLFFVYGIFGFTTRNIVESFVGDSVGIDVSAFVGMFLNVLPVVLVLYLLTNMIYSVIMAVLAATAYEMEDFQKIISPLMITMVIGFYVGLFVIFVPDTTFALIMAHIPLFSLMIAPALWVSGVLKWWNIVIIIGIQVATLVLLYRYGAKTYKQAILDYSGQGVFQRLWKNIRGRQAA
jgi:ABC-2 type transport system permease protein